YGEIGTGNVHSRSRHITTGDGIAQSNISKSAVGSDVSDGSETGLECPFGMRNRAQHFLRRALSQLVDRVDLFFVKQVRMAVNQPRKHGGIGEVDRLCTL